MWNFSIPYKLKHFIDVITQPGLTFSFSPETGFQGLVTGKSVTAVYSRGGEYDNEAAKCMDFQKPYLELVLGFIGFKDINSIIIEPTLADPGTFSNAIDKANVEAAELARKA